MMTRLVQLGVVALWLSMTFWLVRTTWFPDESRFEEVELREVLNAMFENWDDRAEMVLLENGGEVGSMRISATNARSEHPDVSVEDRRHRLSFGGELSEFGVLEVTETGGGETDQLTDFTARRDQFMWQTVVAVDEAYAFASFDVVLRFPQQGARLEVNYVKESEQIAVRAFLNKVALLQFEGQLSELQSSVPGGGLGMGMGLGFPMPSLPGIAGGIAGQGGGDDLLSSLGEWLPGLLSGKPGPETKQKLAAMRPRLTAKFGRTKIAGESLAVYLVLLSIGDDSGEDGQPEGTEKPIRIYIGEDGRPVLIDTPFGFEAIAEVMVPEKGERSNGGSEPEVIGRLP